MDRLIEHTIRTGLFHASGRLVRLLRLLACCVLLLSLQSANLRAQEARTAVIDDSDGFTNVRAGTSKQSAIVTRLQENEHFTVYPTGDVWWRVRTAEGRAGFIHRSCVRLLDPEDDADVDGDVRTAPTRPAGDAAATAPVRKDEVTLAAWKRYVDAFESERLHPPPDAPALLSALEAIDPAGVDPMVAAQITAGRSYLKRAISGNAQTAESERRVQPARDLMEQLRAPARSLGANLMPGTGVPEEYRQQTGSAIGELLLQYCLSDNVRARNLPDVRKLVLEGDQLLIREALMDSALGQEQPPGLKRWLTGARNRAYAERLLTGQWVSRNPDGQVFDLELKTNDALRKIGCGFVTFHARGRQRGFLERDFFKWQFDADDFLMVADGIMQQMDNSPSQTLRGVFVTPKIFKVYGERGKLVSTWERVSRE